MNIFKNKRINRPFPMVKAIKKYPTASLIKLTGVLDFNTISSIENGIRKYQGYLDQDIVLDLKEVTHIDTSTLAVLIYIINTLKQKHRRLSLINCNKLVRGYIKIGKLESVIHVYNTLEDALNGVDGQR